MHQHQHEYLVDELRNPEYTDADSAFAVLNRPPKSFLAVSFVAASRVPQKHPALIVPVSDEYAAQFTSGIPGMPNLIRREDFDAAWNAR